MKKIKLRLQRGGSAFVSMLDLKHVAPFRDVLLTVGFACLVHGVSLLSVAAAWVLAGIGLMAASFAMAKKKLEKPIQK